MIVPTFNRANLLKKCINSVLEQDFENWELLIIDDGSSDETATVVEQYTDERIHYIFQQKAERSQARNRGIALAKGEYICFIDDDDYILSDFLNRFHTAIKKASEPQIYRTGFYYAFADRQKKGRLFQPNQYQHPVDFALREMCGVWSLCIPKVFLANDRFPDFPHWQDTHLILRLLAKFPFQQLPTYDYVYVQHEAMGTQQIFQSDEAIETRLQLNLSAIEHFFLNHEKEMGELITKNTFPKLYSAKLLHYAIAAAKKGNKGKALELFKRSLQKAWFIQHWKYYLIFFRAYFLR